MAIPPDQLQSFSAYVDSLYAPKKPTAFDTLMRIFKGEPFQPPGPLHQIVERYGMKYLDDLLKAALIEVIELEAKSRTVGLKPQPQPPPQAMKDALDSLAAQLESKCAVRAKEEDEEDCSRT